VLEERLETVEEELARKEAELERCWQENKRMLEGAAQLREEMSKRERDRDASHAALLQREAQLSHAAVELEDSVNELQSKLSMQQVQVEALEDARSALQHQLLLCVCACVRVCH